MTDAEARAILGVGKVCDTGALKKAFRKMVRSTHPDYGGNAEDFKKVEEARRVLSGPKPKGKVRKEMHRPARAEVEVEIDPADMIGLRADVLELLIDGQPFPAPETIRCWVGHAGKPARMAIAFQPARPISVVSMVTFALRFFGDEDEDIVRAAGKVVERSYDRDKMISLFWIGVDRAVTG